MWVGVGKGVGFRGAYIHMAAPEEETFHDD